MSCINIDINTEEYNADRSRLGLPTSYTYAPIEATIFMFRILKKHISVEFLHDMGLQSTSKIKRIAEALIYFNLRRQNYEISKRVLVALHTDASDHGAQALHTLTKGEAKFAVGVNEYACNGTCRGCMHGLSMKILSIGALERIQSAFHIRGLHQRIAHSMQEKSMKTVAYVRKLTQESICSLDSAIDRMEGTSPAINSDSAVKYVLGGRLMQQKQIHNNIDSRVKLLIFMNRLAKLGVDLTESMYVLIMQ
ncbi:uncharacterized protein NEMAJ01_1430, partial [Nematocida major]|uniref:uncharacterized protein n=1 Tax=Nematocida major TaxID=1912982 RepID=UPI002007861D